MLQPPFLVQGYRRGQHDVWFTDARANSIEDARVKAEKLRAFGRTVRVIDQEGSGEMRHYEIQRDKEGRPYQMVWLGDSTKFCPLVTRCQCGSTRMKQNRCWTCWRDFGREAEDISYEDAGIYRVRR